jgi:hypothetical protein
MRIVNAPSQPRSSATDSSVSSDDFNPSTDLVIATKR